MINLYTEKGLKDIEKLKKRNLFLMCLFIALSLASLVIFLILASYKTRILFSIISSIVVTSFAFLFIFFLFKFLHFKRIQNEYDTLLNSEKDIIKCEVLECSNYLTTLPDKTRCYEVMVLKDNKEVVYYLSEIFDISEIKQGECKLLIFSDYIKGYQYED